MSYSIDATNDIFRQGRMINDAPNGDTLQNCSMKIVEVESCPRLCIFATRDIEVNEELRYDYGVPTLPWRKVTSVFPRSSRQPTSVPIPF